MFRLVFTMIILIISSELIESKSVDKITVLLSQMKLFAFRENHSLKGLDIEILRNFGKKYNLEIEYVVANETLNEAFSTEKHFEYFTRSMRNSSQVDIFIGALNENLITKNSLIASRPYNHDRITWCVQKRKQIPVWKSIFHLSRDPLVWVIFGVLVFVVLGFAYTLQQFEPRQKWDWNRLVTDGLRSCLGFQSDYNPENTGHRLAFSCILLGLILFSIVLNTGILFIFTNPILRPQIQSIQQIIDEDFILIGDGFAFENCMEQNEVKYLNI